MKKLLLLLLCVPLISMSQDPLEFIRGDSEGDRIGIMMCCVWLFISLIFSYIAYLFSLAGKELENKKLYMAGKLLLYILILMSTIPTYYMVKLIL